MSKSVLENPYKRAAVLLMNLEMEKPGSTRSILSVIGEDLSRKLLKEMSTIESITSEDTYAAFEDFYDIVVENKVTYGGNILPEHIYKETFRDSEGLFETKSELFNFLEDISDEDLIAYFKKESVQLAALILHFLPEERMAAILTSMDNEKSITVSNQLVKLDIPNIALVKKLETFIKNKLTATETVDENDDESIVKLSRSLEIMNFDQQDAILNYFKETDKEMCAKIQSFMLTYPDLVILKDKDMQTLLNAVESTSVLALALQKTDEGLKKKIYDNLSKRYILMLEEEMKVIPEDVKAEDIEANQITLLNLARSLERNGKIDKIVKEIGEEN